jgi:preprotein translocase subunit SecE
MEGKKESGIETKKTPIARQVFNFIGEVKEELGRITWTSADELKVYVKVVVGATVAFGLGVYLVDLGIQGVLRGLGVIVHAMIG